MLRIDLKAVAVSAAADGRVVLVAGGSVAGVPGPPEVRDAHTVGPVTGAALAFLAGAIGSAPDTQDLLLFSRRRRRAAGQSERRDRCPTALLFFDPGTPRGIRAFVVTPDAIKSHGQS